MDEKRQKIIEYLRSSVDDAHAKLAHIDEVDDKIRTLSEQLIEAQRTKELLGDKGTLVANIEEIDSYIEYLSEDVQYDGTNEQYN